jgi:hypothetical protein
MTLFLLCVWNYNMDIVLMPTSCAYCPIPAHTIKSRHTNSTTTSSRNVLDLTTPHNFDVRDAVCSHRVTAPHNVSNSISICLLSALDPRALLSLSRCSSNVAVATTFSVGSPLPARSLNVPRQCHSQEAGPGGWFYNVGVGLTYLYIYLCTPTYRDTYQHVYPNKVLLSYNLKLIVII